MKHHYASILALTLAAFSTGSALASDAAVPKTREQVKAELADAIRTGDISYGETGQKLNELFPHQYPAKPAVQGKTREQVKAELAEAMRNGQLPVYSGS